MDKKAPQIYRNTHTKRKIEDPGKSRYLFICHLKIWIGFLIALFSQFRRKTFFLCFVFFIYKKAFICACCCCFCWCYVLYKKHKNTSNGLSLRWGRVGKGRVGRDRGNGGGATCSITSNFNKCK